MIRARKTNLLEYFGFDGEILKKSLLEKINQNIQDNKVVKMSDIIGPRTNNHVFRIGDESDI